MLILYIGLSSMRLHVFAKLLLASVGEYFIPKSYKLDILELGPRCSGCHYVRTLKKIALLCFLFVFIEIKISERLGEFYIQTCFG